MGGERPKARRHAAAWSKNVGLEVRTELEQLREENKRLRRLVSKLSELVLGEIVDKLNEPKS